MKPGIGLLLVFPLVMAAGCATPGVEQARYSVVSKNGHFQMRDYSAQIVAETEVNATLEDAGNVAFGRLFINQDKNHASAKKPGKK